MALPSKTSLLVIDNLWAFELGGYPHIWHWPLKAFKELATANVDAVTLQFGIRIGGEAGLPYITKGTAESNLNITVVCSFKPKTDEP